MAKLASVLDLSPSGDFAKILIDWNAANSKNFTFTDVAYTKRKELFAWLLRKLRETQPSLPAIEAEKIVLLCLETIRILCREKMALDESFSDENDVWLLIDLAHLRKDNAHTRPNVASVRMETLKCLCNVIYNCPAVQHVCKSIEILDCLIENLRNEASSGCIDVQFALLCSKILFLITGFNQSTRAVAFNHGAIDAISSLLSAKLALTHSLDQHFSECAIESLKAIFNVASSVDHASEGNKPAFDQLADLLRQLIIAESPRQHEICFQSTAIMTLLPSTCFSRFIAPTNSSTSGSSAETYDFSAVQRILDHLDFVLSSQSDTEHLVPLFVALTRMARSNRQIRHYIRGVVLPPLHEADVRRLPQEGSSLRNRICRLLTATSVEVKEHAADFLFVLCKENVKRFIKYTGFGNAAGLLANRGLLGGTRGPQGGDYSDEEDVSDTEDYRSIRHEVNPVTGRVDPPLLNNPFEGMTEEQKEYEAMQLVNAIDRLQRQGLMQPMQLAGGPGGLFGGNGGNNGSSGDSHNNSQQHVQHVLQLREDFFKRQEGSGKKHQNNGDHDEDEDSVD